MGTERGDEEHLLVFDTSEGELQPNYAVGMK